MTIGADVRKYTVEPLRDPVRQVLRQAPRPPERTSGTLEPGPLPFTFVYRNVR
jgi:hypothetical protein